MHTKRIMQIVLVGLLMVTTTTPLFAAVATVRTNTQDTQGAQTTSAKETVKAKVTTDRISAIIARSDKQIEERIGALQDLNTKVQALKHVSDSMKATIAADVQTNITGLTALKAKIDAGTDLATLQEDEKSILNSYRIYALVIPQGRILVSADRVFVITDLLTTVSNKLSLRITEAQTAGKDVTSLTATLTDLNTKISLAKSEATTAQSTLSGLTPDQGDKTKAEANRKALVDARTHIKTATDALKAARKDVDTITKGLKAFHLKASSTPVSTQ